jgi:hypothetical protein
MSDEQQQDDEKEDPALKALLKRSLSVPAPAAEDEKKADPDEELLRAVQRKLRKRSKGKFYSDGWSTTQSRINYVLVAMIMLITIAIVYFALGPTGISK